jgi:flagellar motility protein MotE (MotC chaperone)
MRSNHSPIKGYVLSALLGFLIIKLVFSGLFVYSGRLIMPWGVWDDGTAMAEDEKETEETQPKQETEPAGGDQKTPDVPELSDIQSKIGSLETQLKEINQNLNNYSQHLPRTSGISPETLEQKRVQLEKERMELDAEREKLKGLRQEIDEKVAKLEKIQAAVRSDLEQKKMVQDARIKHLIKVYTTMPPKKAAVLIEKLEMEVIIALFSTMKGENVGQILPYVAPEKAALISERLAKLDL